MVGAVLSVVTVVDVIGGLAGVVSRAWCLRSSFCSLSDSLLSIRRLLLAVFGSGKHAVSVDPITAESLGSLAPVEGMSP